MRWTNTFPDLDPNNFSPAYYTRTLGVGFEVGEMSWVKAFPRVENLVLYLNCPNSHIGHSITSFCTLVPSLKSLKLSVCCQVSIPSSQVMGLVRSLPHLEDLSLHGQSFDISNQGADGPLTGLDHLTPPALTGSLDVSCWPAKEWFPLLLDLPGGLHFTKLALGYIQWDWEDSEHSLIGQLIAACSNTLECLEIGPWYGN